MNDKDGLLPAVYDELRRLASAKLATEVPGHTLDATALVHEAYLKLQGSAEFQSRNHIFRSAALAMQRIPVDHARRKKADKGGRQEAAGYSDPRAEPNPHFRSSGPADRTVRGGEQAGRCSEAAGREGEGPGGAAGAAGGEVNVDADSFG